MNIKLKENTLFNIYCIVDMQIIIKKKKNINSNGNII